MSAVGLSSVNLAALTPSTASLICTRFQGVDLRDDLLLDLLPGSVAVVEAYLDDPADLAVIAGYPEEFQSIDRAIRSRQLEFATGRQCARAALAKLGQPAVAIPRGPRGAPMWPTGFVGSITHCAGFRAAAVASAADILAVGIDAEPNAPLPQNVIDVVSLPRERTLLSRLAATEDASPEGTGTAWDRLLFSAKESVYKIWYPLTGTFLDFVDAELDIDAVNRRFTAHLLVEPPIVDGHAWTDISGQFAVGRGFVVTAISRPAIAGA